MAVTYRWARLLRGVLKGPGMHKGERFFFVRGVMGDGQGADARMADMGGRRPLEDYRH